MKNLSPEYGLTFDDILLVPRYSEIVSRDIPDTSTKIGKIDLPVPIVSSPMDTVSGAELCAEVGLAGGLGVMARDPRTPYKVEDAKKFERNLGSSIYPLGIAIGCKWDDDFLNFLNEVLRYIDALVLDVAHADAEHVHSFVNRLVAYVRSWESIHKRDIAIIAGSIATSSAAERMVKMGVDGLRVGIGNGCFVAGTSILTAKGEKPIENILVGDYVLTHKNQYKKVIATLSREEKNNIFIVNNIECTGNHEFYSIHKKYKNTDDIEKYTQWTEAKDLKDYFIFTGQHDLAEVNIFSKEDFNGTVYDLTVEDYHSYVANNMIVHNSVCSTRLQTGFGMPQLTAISEIRRAVNEDVSIIADGGIRFWSDAIKCLWAGADAVMTGYAFAGCEEAIKRNSYRGMSSYNVTKKDRASEGVEIEIEPYDKSASEIVAEFKQCLQSAMSLGGCMNIKDLSERVQGIRVTPMSMRETEFVDTIKR